MTRRGSASQVREHILLPSDHDGLDSELSLCSVEGMIEQPGIQLEVNKTGLSLSPHKNKHRILYSGQ